MHLKLNALILGITIAQYARQVFAGVQLLLAQRTDRRFRSDSLAAAAAAAVGGWLLDDSRFLSIGGLTAERDVVFVGLGLGLVGGRIELIFVGDGDVRQGGDGGTGRRNTVQVDLFLVGVVLLRTGLLHLEHGIVVRFLGSLRRLQFTKVAEIGIRRVGRPEVVGLWEVEVVALGLLGIGADGRSVVDGGNGVLWAGDLGSVRGGRSGICAANVSGIGGHVILGCFDESTSGGSGTVLVDEIVDLLFA